MSKTYNAQKIEIICPKCKAKSEYEIYQRIDVTDDETKSRIMTGEFFLHKCPECGERINVEYPFLYHQPEDCVMFHYCITEDNVKTVVDMLTNPTKEQEATVKNLSQKSYIIRIVTKKRQLIEKIALYEDGLDDRIVEIGKCIIASQIQRENQGIVIKDMVYVNTADEGKFILAYGDENKIVAKADFPQSLYKKLVDDFGPRLAPLRADRNLSVNGAWANQFLSGKKQE